MKNLLLALTCFISTLQGMDDSVFQITQALNAWKSGKISVNNKPTFSFLQESLHAAVESKQIIPQLQLKSWLTIINDTTSSREELAQCSGEMKDIFCILGTCEMLSLFCCLQSMGVSTLASCVPSCIASSGSYVGSYIFHNQKIEHSSTIREAHLLNNYVGTLIQFSKDLTAPVVKTIPFSPLIMNNN